MKNYKILRIYSATPYQNMYSRFYADRNLKSVSYADAVAELCKQGIIISGQWSSCMRKLGNEALDIVPDFAPLQKKWADEKGLEFSNGISLLYTQIERIRPDVLFFYAGAWTLLPDAVRGQLKTKFPFIKVVTGLWGDPLPPTQNYSKFQDADLLFCAYAHNVKAAEKYKIRAVLNGNCFDSSIGELAAQSKGIPQHDFIFAGSSGYSFPDHVNRYRGLVELIEKAQLKIWGYEPKIPLQSILRDSVRDSMTRTLSALPKSWLLKGEKFFGTPSSFTDFLDRLADSLLGSRHKNRTLRIIREALKSPKERYGLHQWDRSLKPLNKLYPENCFPSKFGVEYFELIQSAKIVFNRHTSETIHAGNIRMFEVTGMGSCLITDNPDESKRHFELDEEIVAYSSIGECIEKVNYLLAHEEKRKAIAEKGRKRTLKDHTVMNRCQIIHEELQKML